MHVRAPRLFDRFTYANVMSTLAVVLVLGGGTAYAVDTVGSEDIIDNSIQSVDIKNGNVSTSDIANATVANTDLSADAVDGSKVFDASLGAADLGFESVASGEIATNAVNGSEVAANAIDSDEVAANTLVASDLASGSVGGAELVDGTVDTVDLDDNSVQSAKIANESVTAFDLAGGQSNGSITLNSGFVATGRCRDVGISVPGAQVGEAILFSVNTDLPDGILLAGVRVIDDDVIQGKACNFTGGVFPQLNNIQVAIVTFRI